MSERPIAVVGLMASGKTTVGRQLAEALGRRFHDSDEDLQRRYGRSAAEHYQRYGAELLHEREAQVLREALAERPVPVVAGAASVVEDPPSREALADAYVVWLDAPPRVLAGRLRRDDDRPDDHRPRYDPDAEAMLSGQYEQRAPWFRALADLTVDVSRATPQQATETILDALAEQRARRG